MFSDGLEFVAAFFGCLYAGVVPAPAFPPRNRRTAPRVQAILNDSGARFCLADAAASERCRGVVEAMPGSAGRIWLVTNSIAPEGESRWEAPGLSRDSLAYLQYTSGSTGDPKGVMVTHGNLLHNLEFLSSGRGHTGIVSWLPLFHDMCLIYAVLQALYAEIPCVLMPPAAFLQRPVRWLEALSRSGYSTAISPNFAYELCVDKITDAERSELDLSRWTMALNAAEPVRSQTIERFARTFAACGFRAQFLRPAYGLAEATLGVAISGGTALCQTRHLDRSALKRNRAILCEPGSPEAVPVVGCGTGSADQEIAIVDPDSLRRCGDSEVGEIWISGPGVTDGYWKRPAETAAVFRALMQDSAAGPFLRTGDLGFLAGGELFVVGRLKDVIIVRGANHHPQDLERVVQESHPALRQDAGAAFAVDSPDGERLVVVQEVVRHSRADLAGVIRSIREAVTEIHGIAIDTLLLVKPHCVPKTSSGKLQRRLARQMFLEGRFEVLAQCSASGNPESPVSGARCSGVGPGFGMSLREWLIDQLATVLKRPREQIDARATFAGQGLDSLGAASWAGQLETALGRSLPVSLVFDHPTIEQLASYLNSVAPGRKLDRKMDPAKSGGAREAIAVVGLACRFPQADTPEAFWDLLCRGVDAIVEVPAYRWDWRAHFHPEPGVPGKTNTRWGGFLNGVDQFAAGFFGISTREAAQMDPQQRILLEVAWEALENAGIRASRIAGSRAGVFVGVSGFDYSLLQLRECASVDAYAATGLAHSIAANRISYWFDFRGPSVVVDTACSSSLVAVHQACESLCRGESDLVLAGGVSLLLSPEMTIALSNARMMAADGRCKTFDRRADGYVRGEGCGMVVLKRQSDAERDGDPILALIHGSAVNQDGRSNGLTAPNGPAQEAVIREALDRAGVMPSEVGHVECHGTGTALGDPQEVEALQNVLGKGGGREQPCWIGSVKTNIGHLESAAGIAGLLKVVLCCKHGQIPPHLHFKELNPYIRLDPEVLQISTTLQEWSSQTRRIAGVSSFGFGGTNSHLVVGEPPGGPSPGGGDQRLEHLLTVSAKSPVELRRCADAMASHLRGQADEGLGDLCFTANDCRELFAHRLALVTGSCRDAAEKLAAFAREGRGKDVLQGMVEGRVGREVVFVFPDFGLEHSDWGRSLFEWQPVFRRVMEQSDEILRPILRGSILAGMYPGFRVGESCEPIPFRMPAFVATQCALSALWNSWGIEPDAAWGCGTGELAAAYAAGVLGLESALCLGAEYARLTESDPENPGWVDGGASRSADSMQGEFERFLGSMRFEPPTIPIVCGSTGKRREPGVPLDTADWVRKVCARSRMAPEHARWWSVKGAAFLRCGPTGLFPVAEQEEALPADHRHVWLGGLPAEGSSLVAQLEAAGRLHVLGFELDWTGIDGGCVRRRRILPTYAFDRKPFWTGGRDSQAETIKEVPASHGCGTGSSRTEAEDLFLRDVWPAEGARFAVLNRLSLVHFAHTMRGLEGFQSMAASGTEIEIVQHSHLHDSAARLLKGMLMHLREEGWPNLHEGCFPVSDRSTEVPVEKALSDAREMWGKDAVLVDWVDHCGRHLEAVLRGTLDPVTVVFPNGSLEPAEWIYRRSSVARFCNSRIADAIADEIHSRGGHRALRLIEIGGGTASTSEVLCSRFGPDQVHYTFTDIGSGFVERARAGYGERANFECGILNIENDPRGQGFAPGGYDIVVAANVLHATRHLEVTLAHVRSLLAPGGLLVLWEATHLQPWLTMTFGLLEGWRRFDDSPLRVSHPLLLAEQWCQLLEVSGFESVEIIPESSELRGSLGQSILLSRVPGMAPSGVPGAAAPMAGSELRIKSGDRGEPLYRIEWISKEFTGEEDSAGLAGSWLVLSDSDGFGETLARVLEQRGGTVRLVDLQSEMKVESSERGDDSAADSLRRVVNEWRIECRDPAVSGVIYIGALMDRGDGVDAVPVLAGCPATGCETLLHLVRSIHPADPDSRRAGKLWVITRGAQSSGRGQETRLNPCQAPLWGFGRSLALESPEIWGGLIDLDPNPVGWDRQSQLVAEAISRSNPEDELMIRGGGIVVPRLRRARRPEPGGVPLGPEGACLVTGGLGGIGLLLSRWLVDHGVRRLILLGRTKLPARSSWKRLVSGGHHPVRRKLEAILDLERSGVTVHYAAVDVARESGLRRFLDGYERQAWPPIRWVFHCAGTYEDAPLAQMETSALRRVFDAKAVGAWNLARQLDAHPIEWMVLFSSAASVLGSRGGANYAAANAFLDALATQVSHAGTRALSIGWGPWLGTGMADVDREQKLRSLGVGSLRPSEALSMLGALLAGGGSGHAVVADVDWPKWMASAAGRSRGMLQELPGCGRVAAPLGAESSDRPAGGPGVSASEDVQGRLCALVAEVFQTDAALIDPERKLESLGLDSIMAIQVKHELELQFDCRIEVHELAVHSIAELVMRLEPGSG